MKSIIFLLLPFVGYSQTYEKFIDETVNESYIRYFDRQAGVIILKTTIKLGDSSSSFFEIGLVVTRNSKSSDDFMKKTGLVIFEDKSYLRFSDPISITYVSDGKHQYSLSHRITDDEFKLLRLKKIESIKVAGYASSFDKWQKQNYLKAFNEIGLQK